MPSHTYEFVEGRDDFSEPDKEILSLRAENAKLKARIENLLIDKETLTHGYNQIFEAIQGEQEQNAKLREESAAYREDLANFTRLTSTRVEELQKEVERLTKERDEEIARNKPLRTLVSSLEKTKSILIKKTESHNSAVATLESERQANVMLTEQLTAALAACEFKDKDKALDELIPLAISDCRQWSSADPETDPYIVQARKVLATQPDASALNDYRNQVIEECITVVEATYQSSNEITSALTELKK